VAWQQNETTSEDPLHIFIFGIRARPKEHRADMESEDPKRDTVVIDITIACSDLVIERM